MSEFGCRCGGIFARDKEGVIRCQKCGSTQPYTMDGKTDRELRMEEDDFFNGIREEGD